jgi:RNA polymerase sigma-70 factor (ECF subfamily)
MEGKSSHIEMAESPVRADSLPTRASLLRRLRDLDDAASWRLFFETYWRLLYNVARKSGLSDVEAQDVVQETVIAVARKMPGFHYDPAKGSFKQWLLLITRRRIQDHFRRVYRSLPTTGNAANPQGSRAEPEAATDEKPLAALWEEEWRANIYQAALARVRVEVNPKHYQIFDDCVLRGLRAPAVARKFGVSVAQVYLARHRVSQAVKRAARAIETEWRRRAG